MRKYILSGLVLMAMLYSCKSDKSKLDDTVNADVNAMDSIYQFVEEIPMFPGCEKMSVKADKKLCSDSLLLKYIYSTVKYPQYAIDNDIQGRCVVSFIVEKDGSISNTKLAKDIGGGCGEAALAVVNSMNSMPEKWIPGKNNGEAKRVIFNLPVSFRLENKKSE